MQLVGGKLNSRKFFSFNFPLVKNESSHWGLHLEAGGKPKAPSCK